MYVSTFSPKLKLKIEKIFENKIIFNLVFMKSVFKCKFFYSSCISPLRNFSFLIRVRIKLLFRKNFLDS